MFPSVLAVVWFIMPAWVANSAAIDVSGLPVLKNYSAPVDFGLKWRGKRIFGDGKTWRGLIAGVLAATACGMVQQQYPIHGYHLMTPALASMMGLGALVGDMVESFIKRQSGLARGHPLFLMDHLDYIFGAMFFAWTMVPVSFEYLIMSCFITLPVHFIANIVAWIVKLKKKPW
ncbi:MAG: CDP-2,3-bis-(O-geranylgeranyl)-sn-glycerol synthase [Candidatus Altiarchaeota archaeon]|nr:CDP-2,3-bis-(O-geranylgeranyl)-sn-glycerol synthase [Candidatus Altiarchaeota archaeon]